MLIVQHHTLCDALSACTLINLLRCHDFATCCRVNRYILNDIDTVCNSTTSGCHHIQDQLWQFQFDNNLTAMTVPQKALAFKGYEGLPVKLDG